MEGVLIIPNSTHQDIELAETLLKRVLSGLVQYLFPNYEYRFNSDYFTFTEPSFEPSFEV
jgi:phenylalanyl-tRNA synthetase alpha subunit